MVKVCTKCKKPKPLSEFYERTDRPGQHHAFCKECDNSRNNQWRRDNIETTRMQARVRAWKLQEIDMTMEKYEYMVMCAGGCCEICGRHVSELEISLCVDHDHKTGEIRGVICDPCNRGIANLQDSIEVIESAAGYLRLSCP